MCDRNIVIWGAGRIGRGFVADLFHAAGYRLTFVEQSQDLVTQLRDRGRYTVVRAANATQRLDVAISGYQALHVGAEDRVAGVVAAADILAIAVFPRDFPDVARRLVPGLVLRSKDRPATPLDIVLCTNLSHAATQFGAQLRAALPPEVLPYIEQHVGTVESLVMRMVADPPAEAREGDPLLVWTNGFSEFPVDRHAFRGPIPEVEGLRLVEDMRAEETRKLYTYNMCHAVLAYQGALRGHQRVVDALADPGVRAEAVGALDETSRALRAEFGYAAEEMARWSARVLAQTDNPTLGDTVTRHGADPRRKLKRDDRLVGPAVLARQHGIEPRHLIRAIAAAFRFRNPEDSGACYVQKRIAEAGIQAAVQELCETGPGEDDLVTAVVNAYDSVLSLDFAP